MKDNQKKLVIKCRHISPPPYLNGLGSDTQKTMQTQEKTSGEEDIESTNSKMNLKTSNVLFKFPFQRRCRSLSLPKDEDGNE